MRVRGGDNAMAILVIDEDDRTFVLLGGNTRNHLA